MKHIFRCPNVSMPWKTTSYSEFYLLILSPRESVPVFSRGAYSLRPEASLSDWSKGAQGKSKGQVWPSFFGGGFLLANGWDTQGNPPSTPAPVIWPSMCQSRRRRWQARDDMAIVPSPVFAAWASQTPENIPVIMAFQCHVARWVWPELRDWRWRDNMFVKFSEFIGIGWGFWHRSLKRYLMKLVCGSVPSDRIYFHPKTINQEQKMLQKLHARTRAGGLQTSTAF